ncbi:aldose epimerase family protein [Micropruina sp.]|uniref:aldose epimerase family protein n=1 Tax=Micropruina sp. TaxID=2737536 RepID=UPI0039E706FF
MTSTSKDVIRLEGYGLAVELLPLGASLHAFEVHDAAGGRRNLVLSRGDVTRHDPFFLGASVGRYANRIAGASFVLDGLRHQLAANEHGNQLHGGPAGFATRLWTIEAVTDHSASFGLVSPDGDQGFPGRLAVIAHYELVEGGARVNYQATTDAATVINLTTHPYFRLGGETIDGHTLTVAASAYTPVRPDLIPTGELAAVAGTALDLREGVLLGPALAAAQADGSALGGGFDHNFVVDGEGLREHVRLVGPDGLTLTVRSDAPAVQLYSGEALGRAGVAIEPQNYPDAPNHPGFPSAVLRPGEVYRTTTEWLVHGG